MVRVKTYQTPVDFDDVAGEAPYWRNLIERLAVQNPKAKEISIAVRGSGGRLEPRPYEIIYVKSYYRGGWGESSHIRRGQCLIAKEE